MFTSFSKLVVLLGSLSLGRADPSQIPFVSKDLGTYVVRIHPVSPFLTKCPDVRGAIFEYGTPVQMYAELSWLFSWSWFSMFRILALTAMVAQHKHGSLTRTQHSYAYRVPRSALMLVIVSPPSYQVL